jgi:hypothetical protein
VQTSRKIGFLVFSSSYYLFRASQRPATTAQQSLLPRIFANFSIEENETPISPTTFASRRSNKKRFEFDLTDFKWEINQDKRRSY